MRRSRPTPLIGLGLAGIVVGFLLELSLAASGLPMLVPPVSLPLTLVVIAIIVVAFAVPIYRAVHGKTRVHINPFQAMRVAVLAKACSMAGAILVGAALGMLGYLLTRSTLPATEAIGLAIGAAAGAVILLVAGLVAEHLCTLPPPRDDDKPAHAPLA